MTETEGIYGGRFSGAGFKGCCMALINPDYAESVGKTIREKYLEAFPEYRDDFRFYLCDTSDGVMPG